MRSTLKTAHKHFLMLQESTREPGLTALLVIQVLLIFFVMPLSSMGVLPHAVVPAMLVLLVVAILVVMAQEYSAVVRRAVQLLERFSPPVVGAVFSRVNQDSASGREEKLAVLPLGLPVDRIMRWFWHEPEQ